MYPEDIDTNTLFLLQGKFIRIHFGPQGKIAGADIETCKYNKDYIEIQVACVAILRAGSKCVNITV